MTPTLSRDGGRRNGLACDSMRCHSRGLCCLLTEPESPPVHLPPWPYLQPLHTLHWSNVTNSRWEGAAPCE